jgi:DNA repair exonuclease SbcCD ATPase subunit
MSDVRTNEIDLSHLDSVEDLQDFQPRQHEAVRELREKISELKNLLREQRNARDRLREAEERLRKAKKREMLGEDDPFDMEERRKEVEDAKSALEDQKPTEEALEELKTRRENLIERLRRQYRDQCRKVYEQLIADVAEPARKLMELRSQIDELQSLFSRVGRGGQYSLRLRGESGDAAAESMPDFPLKTGAEQVQDPTRRKAPFEALKRWIRKWGDPSDWKRWG